MNDLILYIITDGINTKIGKAKDLDDRLTAYNTHNPNYYVYKSYRRSEAQVIEIERLIKAWFKDKRSGKSTEWFVAPPEEVDRIVSALIVGNNIAPTSSAGHLLSPPDKFYELKFKAGEARQIENKRWQRGLGRVLTNKKDRAPTSDELLAEITELVGAKFGLGVSKHRLPEDCAIEQGLGIDVNHCNRKSLKVQECLRTGSSLYSNIKTLDHTRHYYQLLPLASGKYFAMETAIVSMPYKAAVKHRQIELLQEASDFGLNLYEHEEWSWHSLADDSETTLFIYMKKTPIQDLVNEWEGSFKKWVIENSKLIQQSQKLTETEFEMLGYAIRDVCQDPHFPLSIKTFEQHDYFTKDVCGIDLDEDWKDAYKRLFGAWNISRNV